MHPKLFSERLIFDGATGTCLQARGLPPGTPPEAWNLTHPQEVTALHRAYAEAGANVIKTNTFGVNPLKYADHAAYVSAAFDCARRAVSGTSARIAYDVGPLGRLLAPVGDLPFEEAVSAFAAGVRQAVREGADLILIETMTDLLEAKAAVLAAKENSDLPVFVTCAFGEDGQLLTGGTPEVAVALLEGLGVDALGINCSFGPEQVLALLPRFFACASVPLIANPNAGLPRVTAGGTVYDMTPAAFAAAGVALSRAGASVLGGCCGTTPAHIAALTAALEGEPLPTVTPRHATVVCSSTRTVTLGAIPRLIGERINPTGKSKVKEALRCGDVDFLVSEALAQEEAGADILDVNVGLPGIDEPATLREVTLALQSATTLPLQLDSADPAALEAAMRVCHGKPLVNSVTGKADSLGAVLPLVKKYGGVVIALAIGEDGIPATARERVDVILHIVEEARALGIPARDIIADPLTMTVSSDSSAPGVTLEALEMLRAAGIPTVLGLSNVSFGLPAREKVNAAFFAMALERGLAAAIINPLSRPMTDTYAAWCALRGLDSGCARYIAYAAGVQEPADPSAGGAGVPSLEEAVVRGRKNRAAQAAEEALAHTEPMEVIVAQIVPALNRVGDDYGAGKVYLPQLIASAEAAMAAIARVRARMPAAGSRPERSVILATVRGDVHDIGKNIVRTLLESYGFGVIDLGRDVAPEAVLDTVRRTGCKVVGLSALMTTTLPAMAQTVALLHTADPEVRVIVGGAVLTPEYAASIGADRYAPTAPDTVRFVRDYYDCCD